VGISSPYAEEDLIPLSALADLLYCERRAALHLVERVWEESVSTAEGTLFHEKVHGLSPTESRRDVRIARGLRIRSLRLGLVGQADVVEFHRLRANASERDPLADQVAGVALEGVKGLWRPFPIEYKVGALRNEKGFEVQLCAQALCLEEMLDVNISEGALYYGKAGRRLEVVFTTDLRSETEQAAARLHELVCSGHTPKASFEKKCHKCSLLDLCLPRVTDARRSVRSYVRQCMKSSDG